MPVLTWKMVLKQWWGALRFEETKGGRIAQALLRTKKSKRITNSQPDLDSEPARGVSWRFSWRS